MISNFKKEIKMLTRRQFGKTVGYGGLGIGIGMTTMGVSCNTVFQDIEAYVPIGLAAFNEILTLVNPAEAAALAPIIGLVKAAFADLSSDITQYINAPAADKATLLGKVTTAINIVIANLNKFWSDLNLPNSGLASTIVGVLQIVISTLAAFLPLLGGTVAASARAGKAIPIVPMNKKQLGKSQVKASINAAFAKGGYPNKVY
jgi:hypothetical protein